jgi:TetR/AcrR family fatty acid metabolism transcriptional regulator
MNIATVSRIPRPSKEQRIDTIVESARKVFCSRGFEKGSIVDIARDAGIAEGTLYRYFDGKRGLLDEVLRRHYLVVFDDVQQTLPNMEGHGNRLRYLIRRILLAISGDRGMCGLITRDIRQFDDKQPSLAQDLNRQMAVLMADEIKAGIKSGSFRADTSPRIVCDMIGGGLEVIAHAYMRTGRAIDVNNVTESIFRTVLGGIQSKDATAESMAKLVQRLEHAADRLDSK